MWRAGASSGRGQQRSLLTSVCILGRGYHTGGRQNNMLASFPGNIDQQWFFSTQMVLVVCALYTIIDIATTVLLLGFRPDPLHLYYTHHSASSPAGYQLHVLPSLAGQTNFSPSSLPRWGRNNKEPSPLIY